MKLMDIDSDTLGIPDTDYDARVTMRASEFSRIVRDLSLLGESVRIEVTKEGVRFASDGEAANGNVLLKQTEAARERYADYGKEDDGEEGGDAAEGDEEEDEKKTKKAKVKKEKVKKEAADTDDVEMEEGNEDEEFKVKSDDEGEEEALDDEEGSSSKKKRKKSSANVRLLLFFFPFSPTDGQKQSGKPAKKVKKSSDDDENSSRGGVSIEMNQHVALTFSLKYLVHFSKSSTLSDTVQLMMSNDVPLLVCVFLFVSHATELTLDQGFLSLSHWLYQILSGTKDWGRLKVLVHRSANLLPCIIECHRIYQHISARRRSVEGHEDFAWIALFGTICS